MAQTKDYDKKLVFNKSNAFFWQLKSFQFTAKASGTMLKDSGIDFALKRFRRVIAAGEKGAEGLGIDP